MRPHWLDRIGLLGTFAGALAFFFLLALVPLFLVAAMLVEATLHVDIVPQVRELLRELLPSGQAPERVAQAVSSGMSRGWFTAGFAGALWASISFMNELARAIHVLFADHIDPRAGGWWRWFKAIGLNILWCGVLIAVCMLFILSHSLQQEMTRWPWLEQISGPAAALARWLATLLLLAGALTFTYRLIPAHSPRLAACATAGLGVALAWMLMGSALTRALPLVWAQSPLPVAFGSFLITMFWAYACCWILLIGALILATVTRRSH